MHIAWASPAYGRLPWRLLYRGVGTSCELPLPPHAWSEREGTLNVRGCADDVQLRVRAIGKRGPTPFSPALHVEPPRPSAPAMPSKAEVEASLELCRALDIDDLFKGGGAKDGSRVDFPMRDAKKNVEAALAHGMRPLLQSFQLEAIMQL